MLKVIFKAVFWDLSIRAELFGVEVPAISKHLKNIFERQEVSEDAVISKIETTETGDMIRAYGSQGCGGWAVGRIKIHPYNMGRADGSRGSMYSAGSSSFRENSCNSWLNPVLTGLAVRRRG